MLLSENHPMVPCQMSVRLYAQSCEKMHGTWSVADVGHGAAFGGDVAHVHLLGLDLDLRAAA